jgi:hypothetical protein
MRETKWQKAEPETKRPSLSDERFANWCVDSFEDQKDRYHAFVGEQSRWIDILESRLLVSEAAHTKLQGESDRWRERFATAVDKGAVLESENAKLRERLEAIRKHYEKLPTWKEARQKSTATNKVEEEQIPAHLILIDMWNAWARELGVLLSAKELDQKTREGDSK